MTRIPDKRLIDLKEMINPELSDSHTAKKKKGGWKTFREKIFEEKYFKTSVFSELS